MPALVHELQPAAVHWLLDEHETLPQLVLGLQIGPQRCGSLTQSTSAEKAGFDEQPFWLWPRMSPLFASWKHSKQSASPRQALLSTQHIWIAQAVQTPPEL